MVKNSFKIAVGVVYFNQRMGAALPKRWSK